MNKVHWIMLGLIMFLLIVYIPKTFSESPATNQELLEWQNIYYTAHITHKPIQMESACGDQKVLTYGWLNTGDECLFDWQCKTMIDDGVSYEVEARSFCCLVGLAKGTCVEVRK